MEKIFHSCDYDIRSLDRDYHGRVKNLFDTSIAAQFLGSKRLGLGNVLQEYLDVILEKSKKLQQMDKARQRFFKNMSKISDSFAEEDPKILDDILEEATHVAKKAELS